MRETQDNDDTVHIFDFKEGRWLILDQDGMKAHYMSLEGYPRSESVLEAVKRYILMLKSTPGITVEELGVKRVDGYDAVGFYAHWPKGNVTIWADVNTELPIRIEANIGELRQVIWNVEFDTQMEEKLFSMEVPAGYTLTGDLTMDARGGDEAKFIKGLKVLAEASNGGEFTFCESVDDVYAWRDDLFKKIDTMNVSEEEKEAIGQKFLDVMSFIAFISRQGKWSYRGEGVRLGEADTPIFWYSSDDSETYRVIYGDLHVENIARENPPR